MKVNSCLGLVIVSGFFILMIVIVPFLVSCDVLVIQFSPCWRNYIQNNLPTTLINCTYLPWVAQPRFQSPSTDASENLKFLLKIDFICGNISTSLIEYAKIKISFYLLCELDVIRKISLRLNRQLISKNTLRSDAKVTLTFRRFKLTYKPEIHEFPVYKYDFTDGMCRAIFMINM